jgi:hypothetical protein
MGQTSSNGSQGSKYEPYDQARQKTGEVIDQVQEKVGEVADQVKEQATSQISSQKDQIAEGLGSMAQMIRFAGDQLRQNNQGMFADYTDRAAHSVENASKFLRERELGEIVGEVENFARREPVLFLGGAFTLGLLAARFLKSSAPSSQSSSNRSTALAPRPSTSIQTTNQSTNRSYSSPTTNSGNRSGGYGYSGDYSATSTQTNGSSLTRHFGEDNPAGQSQSHNPNPGATNSTNRMSNVDQP